MKKLIALTAALLAGLVAIATILSAPPMPADELEARSAALHGARDAISARRD